MKNITKKLIVLFIIAVSFPNFGWAQEKMACDFTYDVNIVYPPLSMSKAKLDRAKTLADLNRIYKKSWVREFISVEISAMINGELTTVESKNDVLTQGQKDMMSKADLGKEISVVVKYIPENTLPNNEVKVIDFEFTIDPDNEAKYSGGHQQLLNYIKENAIDKVSFGVFKRYQLAGYTFTIDEQGDVINPRVFWSSEDEKIDQLLIEAICNMPKWKPAEYSAGLKVKQDFVVMLGDKESCARNMLNTRLPF